MHLVSLVTSAYKTSISVSTALTAPRRLLLTFINVYNKEAKYFTYYKSLVQDTLC